MKRIISLFLSIMMVLPLMLSAFAAGFNDTTISFSLTSDGKNTVYVSAGEEITVSFSLINKSKEGEAFTVESIYNDVEIDNDFFEIDDNEIESSVIAFARFQADSDKKKWARFNGEHFLEPEGLRTYSDGEVVGTFKLKVKAASGQSTISTTSPSLYDDGYVSYNITKDNLTVIVGKEPAKTYTVKYMSEGKEVATSQNAQGTITIGTAPDNGPEGYIFKGWEDKKGALYKPGDSFTLTGDTTFTARWEQQLMKYTLTFDTNGGTVIDKITEIEGTVIKLSDYTTTREGYTFDGWYEDAAFTTPVTSNFRLGGDKTIYAKWTENAPKTFTLTFNTNGGSAVLPITREKDTVILLSDYKPTKDGYNFNGWYTDSEFTTKVTSITLTSDTTIYAKWSKKDTTGGGGAVSEKYTLSFNTNGGNEIKAISVSDNKTVDLSKYVPQKDGYIFKGWHSDKELTKPITEIKLSANTTIYAKWEKADGETPGAKPNYKPDILTDEHYAYIVGRDGGFVAPESNITRAEVSVIIYRLLDEDVRNKAKTKENVFTDVNEGDWFNTAVSTLASLELVKGQTEETYAPDVFITRAELATIFARMVEVEYDGKTVFSDISGHWAESDINEAATAEWIVGFDGLFRPDDNITRAEVMTLVNRVLNRVPENKADLLDGMTTWVDNADENAWYYLAVQEATNSHTYERKADGKHEKWISLTENPDWSKFE